MSFGNPPKSFIFDNATQKQKLKRSLSEENYVKFIIDKMCRIRRIREEDVFRGNEMIDCYRYLRNRLADPEMSPELLQTFLDNAEGLAGHVESLLTSDVYISEETMPVFRIAVQFLGNAVTRMDTAKVYRDAIWRNGAGMTFWIEMLSHSDEKIRVCGSMLIYNSLRDPIIRTDVMGCHELVQPIFGLACPIKEEPIEWCLFTAQMLLAEEESFLECAWPKLEMKYQVHVLLVAQESLLDAASNASTPVIHEKNASYLASVFVEETGILEHGMQISWPASEYELEIMSELLAFLCQITALEDRYQSIRGDQRVLAAAVNLLKISAKSQLNPNEELEKLAAQAQSKNGDCRIVHPFVNFRTRLVQLLANCAYKHPANQKFIGELGGVPLILNSTPLDAENAFITEWSVFALRNLLDGCPENQLFVKKLQSHGFQAGQNGSAGSSSGKQVKINVGSGTDSADSGCSLEEVD